MKTNFGGRWCANVVLASLLVAAAPGALAQSLTMIWNVPPGTPSANIAGSGTTERTLSFNPVTGNVIYVSRSGGGINVNRINGVTGTIVLPPLNTNGIVAGTIVLNASGVAEDGVIYACNIQSPVSGANPLKVYRWQNESAAPTLAFSGDPNAGAGGRWGDAIAVRGSGPNTQILVSSDQANAVALLTTVDGIQFTATKITIAGGATGVANYQTGLAWGPPGSNTFWGKRSGNGYSYRVVFNGPTGSTVSTSSIHTAISGIAFNPANNLFGGVTRATAVGSSPQSNILYNVSADLNSMTFADQKPNPVNNADGGAAQSGAAWGNGRLFTEVCNNGIVAFSVLPFIRKHPSTATNPPGSTASFTASADGTGPLTYQWRKNGTNIPGATFSNLTFTVSCSDGGSYSVTVSNQWGTATSSNATLVVDTQPPNIFCPGDMFVMSTGPGGAVVTYPTPTANDNCTPNPTVVCNPPSGSTFTNGTNIVVCTATDAAGNSTNCTFKVIVALPALFISCPADMTVGASNAAGAVVNYPTPMASGGCSPIAVNCNPPSGSTFPVGTNVVNCVATDGCGQVTNCTFLVVVTPPPLPPAGVEIFVTTEFFPPTNGMYVDPQTFHTLYQNGVYIDDPAHYSFTGGGPPPPPNGQVSHGFGSSISGVLNNPGAGPFVIIAPGNVSVSMSHVGVNGSTSHYQTEMQQLDVFGGGLPPGVIIRESPTLQSGGHTTSRPVPGGYMVSSFFDIFTEISMDGGLSWSPAQQGAHMELRKDPRSEPPIDTPTDLLPPPNGQYVSPDQWHALFAQGIVIKDVSHDGFTQSHSPPSAGGSNTHVFNSKVEMEISTDGGNTFTHASVSAPVTVGISRVGDGLYDTEMTSLDITGLPGGIMIRESPSLPSRGGVVVVPNADGTYRVSSFFDVFPEISLDGGATWAGSTSGPVHLRLVSRAPEVPKPTPDLPPLDGEYISPEKWHALYANGIIISNASHDRFTQTQPPPPPGGSQVENFGSRVRGLISLNGGASFQPFQTPASVAVLVNSRADLDTGATRFFDTEMLGLNASGGTLPGGLMIRESPSKASIGKTSVRQTPSDYRIASFFDIFTEVSLDGGATWSPSISGPGTLSLTSNAVVAITVTCPSNITVAASGPAGAVVNYTATASGGCGPLTVVGNPPSGSTFPIGTTTVTVTASDACGNSATCSFTVKVTAATANPTEVFNPSNVLPPPGSVYISPAQWHALYANGIVIRNVSHRKFMQSQPPPPLGSSQVHTFGSQVDFEISADGGNTFQPGSGIANVTVQVTHDSDNGSQSHFDTEMLQLDLVGPGFMLRESPTLQSLGQTTIRPVSGGYMIGSFFDVFTEISLDGGATWTPAQQSGHVEMRNDPAEVPAATQPTDLLPPPNGGYVSPQQWHALFAQGIVIKDVSHKFFTDSQPPPAPGTSNTHAFDSVVDLQISTDGGTSFQSVRASAPVTVRVTGQSSGGSRFYDTEMLSLSLTLPSGIMLRESPSLPSRGGTVIQSSQLPPGDPDFDLLRIHSFFDIFVEVSLDGGATWSPPTNGPVRMQLVPLSPEVPKPNPNLPPLDGNYVSPAQWHALYANGIIISNASHDRFTQTQPPPPPGGSQTENFGSRVLGMISVDGGASFQPFSASANVAVQVTSSLDSGNTRFFNTEMLALSLSGGTLPGGVMVRESPSKASLGRTSIRVTPTDFRIGSFFDIFTEVSLDGGANWSPSITAPGTLTLSSNAVVAVEVTCPSNITATAADASGAVVFFTPIASGGCGPLTIVANPPSGSTFPIGTTTVTVTATDACGGSATCSFTVTVNPPPPPPVTEVFFKDSLLPPTNGTYISPAMWHALYANGIVIKDVRHHFFTGGQQPPPPGSSQIHTFSSRVDAMASTDGGASFQPISGDAQVSVNVSRGTASGTVMLDTEMLQLDLNLGPLRLRESPTLQSTGHTTVRSVPGGYMIGSFFDVFTEISTDGGVSWVPANDSAHVELRADTATVPATTQPTPLLPPPDGAYISPDQWHALYAQGIVIRDVKHSFFVGSQPPPASGGSNTHTFDSRVDMKLSMDGGVSFTQVRAPAAVTVQVVDRGGGLYDTEMIALDVSGGDLPPALRFRESPSLPSRGGTSIDALPQGGQRIGSFFDIFTEISLDGGNTWHPGTGGPVHVELSTVATPHPVPNPNLPPLNGQYISPAQWHALYANGIIISNVSHKRFTQTQPPPPPGGSQVHNFGSQVEFDLIQPGQAPVHVTAPAAVVSSVTSAAEFGGTRFFNTEMLSLNIGGGGLPAGVRVRESPSKASLGRTTQTFDPSNGQFTMSSFFDIFTEISLDNGANWSPAVTAPGTVGFAPQPLGAWTLSCPSNITVTASGSTGAVVNFLIPFVFPDCPFGPFTVTANPPSGSTFPIGTTTVTVTGSDGCGEHPTCSFTVTVLPPTPTINAPEIFSQFPLLPPPSTVYISPALWHALYANGIVIRNVSHRKFTDHLPPPPPGANQVHTFSSQVDFEVSLDNGNTFQPGTGLANVSVNVTHSSDAGGVSFFDTEMLQLDLVGPGFRLRESPTLQSVGQTTVRPIAGGYMISSFFDVFTEISTDNGVTWTPAQQSGHMEMRNDPAESPAAPNPSDGLPPHNGAYVSPQQWHALFAQGIVIKDVSHKFFTDSQPPPAPGTSNTHAFDSVVDLQISTDGGTSFQSVRASAPVTVRVTGQSSGGSRFYDTEMLSLSLNGLPNGIMLRESPSRPSRGATLIESSQLPPGDPDFDLLRIHSFFDIFTEISLDGGATWSPPTNGPVRVQLVPVAPEIPKPTPNLPPLDGNYVSPAQWHALYANGIIISNASHDRFTQTQPPPPPGGSQTENFGSRVSGMISTDGGASFQPFSAPAATTVQVGSRADLDGGNTRFFDTEMLALNLAGGTLPAGVMVRESPSKASLGRTSIRATPADFRILSFFDVFTEVSTDGGATWSPQLNNPATMALTTTPSNAPLTLVCPSNIVVTASNAAGAVVNYPAPAVSGGCPPYTIVCNPPSGSTFPYGITTVNCTVTDACGATATCQFRVTVRTGDPCLEVDNGNGTVQLPPPDCQYLSPQQVHMIIDGLPPGTTIQLAAIHKNFICREGQHPCPNDCFVTDDCDPSNGATEQFNSTLELRLVGTGLLNGWTRNLTINNVLCQSQVGPRNPGAPVQDFDTDMQMVQGQLPPGDPDFDLLRVTGGTSFGLPSPGHTTLTRQPGGNWAVDSFFDITYRIDFVGAPGGALAGRSGSTTGTIRMTAVPATNAPPPLTITCPSNIVVAATGPAGAVVNYPAPTVSGGCPPYTVVCTPPSGSTFPIGTTTVNCVVTDSCGNSTECQFNVTVQRVPNPHWFPTPTLPPQQGEYISPQRWHQLYANGIIISNASHRKFLQTFPPPPAGGSATHNFGSTVEVQVSTDGGNTFTPMSGPADVTVRVTHAGTGAEGTVFDTEMLQLNLVLPGGLMIRESPTKASLGRTSIRQAPGGGFMIDSFFDVFTELSTDGGASWSPANNAATVELAVDPRAIPSVSTPTQLLPPPNDVYVSPAQYHLLAAQGIIIRDVKHKFFTQSLPPPPPGGSQTHTFDSYVDLQLSQNGGQTFTPVRAPAAVSVHITHRGTAPDGTRVYDTEMLQLNLQGGGLPPGLMIRESPTRRSEGAVAIETAADGSSRIGSFFDIWTELSVDGGQTWTPLDSSSRVELQRRAAESSFPSSNLPPLNGQYVSPQQFHVLYANGIILSNVSHKRFTDSLPPPPPGGQQTHSFGSQVEADLIRPGQSPLHITVPASVQARVSSTMGDGDTRYFDTEMLQLSLSGGGFPTGVMVRESPSKASLGRTSIRSAGPTGGSYVSSFFDIFTEISTDGGETWSPQVSSPTEMSLEQLIETPCIGPASMRITSTGPGAAEISWTGSGFRLQYTDALEPGGSVWVDVPGSSPVPITTGNNKRFYRLVCP